MRRVLLDNCIDRRFGAYLEGFEVVHTLDHGWTRLGDSTLVRVAVEEFDVLVTVDRSMPSQINLSRFDLAVVVLQVPSNRLKDCVTRVSDLKSVLADAMSGRFTFV